VKITSNGTYDFNEEGRCLGLSSVTTRIEHLIGRSHYDAKLDKLTLYRAQRIRRRLDRQSKKRRKARQRLKEIAAERYYQQAKLCRRCSKFATCSKNNLDTFNSGVCSTQEHGVQ